MRGKCDGVQETKITASRGLLFCRQNFCRHSLEHDAFDPTLQNDLSCLTLSKETQLPPLCKQLKELVLRRSVLCKMPIYVVTQQSVPFTRAHFIIHGDASNIHVGGSWQ